MLDLVTLPNGDLIVCGYFTTAGGSAASRIARWDGSNWSPLGSGMYGSVVRSLTTLPNGDLVAAGSFVAAGGTSASNIARWDGTSWSALGSGGNVVVVTVTSLPNGDVIAGGDFTASAGAAASHIARWDGTSWSPLGLGINSNLYALTTLPNGDVVAGGEFTTANGIAAARIARLTTTCPATVTSLGGGCPSSGGSNSMTATLPWTGSTWTATGTGLSTSAFVAFANGFTSTSTTLASILPQGVLGCSLLVSPDYVDFVQSNNGVAQAQLVLPNTPLLAGTIFYSQMVPLEFDASLNILAVTSTNAVAVTVGSF